MRIFIAVRHAGDPRRFYGGLWSANFYPALRALGHELVESQVDLEPASRFMDIAAKFTAPEREVRAATTQKILDEVRAAHAAAPVHLFLSYFYNAHFDPAGFDVLRTLGIPSINFYCNGIHQFELVAAVAAAADIAWHTEKHAAPSYRAAGAHPLWIRMGADPDIYRPCRGADRVGKACFIGQHYADRDRWLAALAGAGLPLDIYGAGWGGHDDTDAGDEAGVYLGRRRPLHGSAASYLAVAGETIHQQGLMRGSVRLVRQAAHRRRTRARLDMLRPFARGHAAFERMPEIYSGYAVSLNFNHVWADGRPGSRLVPHIRLRDVEAPMAGACYLTGECDELADYYEIGREVDTYSSEDELIDKTRFYLSNRTAGDRLRAAGHERARRDHTWQRRFEVLFKAAGLQRP